MGVVPLLLALRVVVLMLCFLNLSLMLWKNKLECLSPTAWSMFLCKVGAYLKEEPLWVDSRPNYQILYLVLGSSAEFLVRRPGCLQHVSSLTPVINKLLGGILSWSWVFKFLPDKVHTHVAHNSYPVHSKAIHIQLRIWPLSLQANIRPSCWGLPGINALAY